MERITNCGNPIRLAQPRRGHGRPPAVALGACDARDDVGGQVQRCQS
jgi:hypothetical protein